jgi:primosomal protein N' (replication factor Y)
VPQFCDVALPVPLETCFTYRLNGVEPPIGGRVLVPFRNLRLPGIVTDLHDHAPSVGAKNVIQILDKSSPVISAELMRVAKWISHYYLAPLGEVFRTMLPLSTEVKRARVFRITDAGWRALHEGAECGSSRRSKKGSDDQMLEYQVLDYIASRDAVREQTVRTALRATRAVLTGLVRKRWILAEDISSPRDVARQTRVIQLKKVTGKLNNNQQRIVEILAAAGGRIPVEQLYELSIPRCTLQTLVRRGIAEIVEEPAQFSISRLQAKPALDFSFNPAQTSALEQIKNRINEKRFSATLLFGVTGSGKTAVYLAAMQHVLAAGRSAIMLVPEIGLTPQVAANLHEIFGDQAAILHSALSEAERAEQWHRIRDGHASIVVGTRSAVFAPVCDLALIVVDEEQDSSYKQEEMPRYNGRDVAVIRAKICGAAVVLGSATPALESFYNTQSGKYELLELPDRVEQRPLPDVDLVDMRAEFQQCGEEQVLSRRLIEEIRERLDRGEQAMILLNRRGYSPVVFCRSCGETVRCKDCAVATTHHRRVQRLMCHYCGYQAPIPKLCPKCASEYVFFLGTGSEKLEDVLHQMFPTARIARLDRDTVRGHADFERVLSALHAGELDLLVGTQMIAKGHDIHGITLVGVVGADFALGFPDFRAAERTFQLLTQVAGRAGRGTTPGRVILQTFFPEHYAIKLTEQHDYRGFYDKELQYRRWMHYPPFTALANVLVRSDQLGQALKYSGAIGRWLKKNPPEGVRVLGPAPAPLARLKREYRYHFILKSVSRKRLNTLLRSLLQFADREKVPHGKLVVDVDPVSLL